MPEHMRTQARALHLGALERTGGNLCHGFRTQWGERSDRGQKHVLTRHARSLVCHVGEDSLAHLLWERKAAGAPGFASHAERAILPVDIAPLQCGDIASAEP